MMIGYFCRAPVRSAAQPLDRRIDLFPFRLFADQLERFLRQAVEAEDEASKWRIQDAIDVVPAIEQRAVGIEHEVPAADLVGIFEPVPQLVLVAHDQGFAVEGRPDLGVGGRSRRPPRRSCSTAAAPCAASCASIHGGCNGCRSDCRSMYSRLRVAEDRHGPSGAPRSREAAGAAVVLEMLLEQGKIGAHSFPRRGCG